MKERGLKKDCPGCQKIKAEDWANRWPVGACSPTCLILPTRKRRVVA